MVRRRRRKGPYRYRRVEASRRNVADPMARFQISSFEDFADSEPLDLIVSATAFHWVDPSIGMAKAARLLRPGGWLALRLLWMRYSRRQTGKWTDQPARVTALRQTTLFGGTVEASHTRALRLPAQTVLGVERTRATFLSYSKQDQASFTADLRMLLEPSSHVDLVQETLLAMAPAATGH